METRSLEVSSLAPEASKDASMGSGGNEPRKKRKSRKRKEFAFDQHRLQGAAKKWLYAVSSQVMAWLAMSTATEIPSRRSGRRELDFISIPAARAAMR